MAQKLNDGKKGSKPKKAGNPKKKGGSAKPKKKGKKGSLGLFSKIMIIVFIVLLAAVLVLSNIKKTNKTKEESKTETIIEKAKNNSVEDSISHRENISVETEEENGGKTSISRRENISVEKSVVVKSIEGSWLSTMKGAVLTMKDFEYRIDFSGVDASNPIIGKFEVDGNKVIFKNSQDPCKDVEGVYKVEIDRGNISFTCKKDGCTKRKNTLAADWEWFEN